MIKYKFEDLVNVSSIALEKIKLRQLDRLADIQRKRFCLIASIMFLENEIEKENNK